MQAKSVYIEKALTELEPLLKKCSLCPRNCQVNRTIGEKGYCSAGKEAIIYSYFLHPGEEPVISGKNGSGTIFFSGCNLKCVFCQNYKFSHTIKGKPTLPEELARIMLKLQAQGSHNINLVTPTHFLPQILKALKIALQKELNIPIVYNTSGYEKPEIIRLLKGIVDIYLYDLKYWAPETAQKYSNAPDYPEYAFSSLIEAYKGLKNPKFGPDSTLIQGVIVRHLVLPEYSQESQNIIKWIHSNTPKAYLSLMSQYKPYFKAYKYPQINRTITKKEYQKALTLAINLNIQGWFQDEPMEELAGVYFKPKK